MTKKLRLIGRGFENYTGAIGVVNFVDGLSTTTPHQMDVNRLTCTIGARWDDGSPSSVGERYEAMRNVGAPTDAEVKAAAVQVQEVQKQDVGKRYTAQELAAIADAKGIAGLREVGETLGVKGKSIKELIEGILKVAGAEEPAQEAPAQEGAEVTE